MWGSSEGPRLWWWWCVMNVVAVVVARRFLPKPDPCGELPRNRGVAYASRCGGDGRQMRECCRQHKHHPMGRRR